ncbi:hypothetical protein [Flavobacterium piscis]|uniref:YD repeat-containing protein n=1 Tax=Flavobacterium piscis TaxID=1114874 RepID=A0ABU1Y9S8_9FLAO|nr:hypothetical protein [Flavobacterium piscis]MDR7210994.1 hypothetical protein [Flavobacterium piscis]
MKKTLLAFFLLLTMNNIYSQINQKSDKDKLKLKGAIKTIEQRGFKAIEKFGEIMSENSMNDIYDFNSLIQFDKIGNIISINLLDLEGSIKQKTYKTFLNGNEPVIIKGYKFNETYRFDENNNISEIIYNNEDETLNFKVINKFNNLNDLIEQKVYEKDGVLNSIEKRKYDSFGNVTEINQYMSNTKKTTTETVKYFFDSQNNWIKKIRIYEGELYTVIERKIIYY